MKKLKDVSLICADTYNYGGAVASLKKCMENAHYKFVDLTGRRFGKLIVICQSNRNSRGFIQWLCSCDCGSQKNLITASLKSGNTQSCGCLQKERASAANTTHGLYNHYPEYGIWNAMKNRCYNKKVERYNRYGGRGIMVCDIWIASFEAFITDMGRRPSKFHSIERLNSDGDYCSENCIWATGEVQSRNRRDNIKITINGVSKLMIDWAKEYGVKENLVRSRRARGWRLDEKIFTTPKNKPCE